MNSKIWVSSDLHWGHGNNCVGTSQWGDKSNCRPFNTVEEHDELLLKNINEVIAPEDTFYILGDFCVGSNSSYLKMKKLDAYRYYRNKINCDHIIYIRGNHSPSMKELKDLNNYQISITNCPIFEEVYDYYEFRHKKNFICMFHFPLRSWNHMSKGSYCLYGHQHSNSVFGRSMDVGVDSNDFKPYLLDDIIEKLKYNEIIKEGHHV